MNQALEELSRHEADHDAATARFVGVSFVRVCLLTRM